MADVELLRTKRRLFLYSLSPKGKMFIIATFEKAIITPSFANKSFDPEHYEDILKTCKEAGLDVLEQ